MKICFYCNGKNVIKKGVQRGLQRWFCKDCCRYFTRTEQISTELLYEEYIKGKQTLKQLSESHQISISTIQRRFKTIHHKRLVSKEKDVVVLMDATYWGHRFGVLVFKDAHRNKILWRKFLSKKETVADYYTRFFFRFYVSKWHDIFLIRHSPKLWQQHLPLQPVVDICRCMTY